MSEKKQFGGVDGKATDLKLETLDLIRAEG